MITEGDGGWGVGPRTAIGQKKDGTVLFLVIDGRQPGYSIGATLRDVQDILFEKGCYIAANLDGGSSSTLYLNGKVVNKPDRFVRGTHDPNGVYREIGGQMKPFTRVLSAFAVGILLQGGVYLYLDQYMFAPTTEFNVSGASKDDTKNLP